MVVTNLYGVLIDSRVTGAPTAAQLESMLPYLSAELLGLLREARALSDAESAADPDEKPPFADGDLFSSAFEGPTGLTIVADSADGVRLRLLVQFTDERATPVFTWTDTLVVQEESGRLVVADVLYGGSWPFANRGSLVASLTDALRGSPAIAVWSPRCDDTERCA